MSMPPTTPLQPSPDARPIEVGGGQDEVLLALLKMGIASFAFRTPSGAVIEAELRLVAVDAREPQPSAVRPAPSRLFGSGPARLTARQLDVVRLIAGGGSNKDIARELDLSPATVKTHTASAIAALGAINRTDAAMRAREMGLV